MFFFFLFSRLPSMLLLFFRFRLFLFIFVLVDVVLTIVFFVHALAIHVYACCVELRSFFVFFCLFFLSDCFLIRLALDAFVFFRGFSFCASVHTTTFLFATLVLVFPVVRSCSY